MLVKEMELEGEIGWIGLYDIIYYEKIKIFKN